MEPLRLWLAFSLSYGVDIWGVCAKMLSLGFQ